MPVEPRTSPTDIVYHPVQCRLAWVSDRGDVVLSLSGEWSAPTGTDVWEVYDDWAHAACAASGRWEVQESTHQAYMRAHRESVSLREASLVLARQHEAAEREAEELRTLLDTERARVRNYQAAWSVLLPLTLAAFALGVAVGS